MGNVQLACGLIEAECRDELAAASSLMERVEVAFKAAKNHWMIVDEDEQFKGACGAVLMHSSEEDRERIEAELRQLCALSALLSGVNAEIPESSCEPIGLMGIWKSGR